MKLYLKHIINNIKNKPAQPILIVITIMMSAVLFVMAFQSRNITQEFNALASQAYYGDSDICINANVGNESSFMSLSDVNDVIGNDNDICGYYQKTLMAKIDEENVLCDTVATDFTNTGYLTKFDFIKKTNIDFNNMTDSAIINKTFAEQNNLKLGDTLEISLGKFSSFYTIRGIVKQTGIFFRNQLMVDIDSIIHKLANETGLYLLDYNFKPYNYILIKLKDTTKLQQTMDILSNSKQFSKKAIIDSKDYEHAYNLVKIENFFVRILTVLMVLLAIWFIYSTFSVSLSKRLHSNALFRGIGASKSQLFGIMIIEAIIYGFLGGLLSLPIAKYALKFMQIGLNVPEITFSLDTLAIICVFVFGITISVLSVILATMKTVKLPLDTMLKGETKHFRLPNKLPLIVLLALCLPCVILLTIISVKYYYIVAIILFFIVLFIFLLGFPYIAKWCLSLIEFLLNKKKKQGIFSISIKNSKRNFGVQNFNRILTIVFAFLFVMTYVIVYAQYTVDAMTNVVKSEIFIQKTFGEDEEDILALDKLEEIESVTAIFSTTNCFFDNGQRISVFVIDGDEKKVINFENMNCKYNGNLKDNEIIIPKSIALEFEKEVGDSMNLTIKQITKTYVIKNIIDTNYSFVVATYEGCGIECQYFMVDIADGFKVDKTITKIKSEFNNYDLLIFSTEYISISMINGIKSFINLAKVVLVIIVILAIIAMSDSLIDSYRMREKEFLLLKQAGMNKKEKFLLIFSELSVNFVIAIISAFLFAMLMIKILSIALLSYGVNLIIW